MRYSPVSLFILVSILYCNVSESEAIVKGENALPGEFPSIVSLRNETGKHYCGGTLVTRKHIVTAAHCIYEDSVVFNGGTPVELKPENVKAVVGTLSAHYGGDAYDVEKFIVHPQYDVNSAYSLWDDVAIIVLKKEVNTENVVPTPISIALPENDAFGNTAGWGLLNFNISKHKAMHHQDFPNYLQKLPIKILDKAACKEKYRTNPIALKIINTEYIMCALPIVDGAGVCIRDSGSPLMVDGEFVGFVLGGNPCGNGYPDFFGSTSAHQDFINSVIHS